MVNCKRFKKIYFFKYYVFNIILAAFWILYWDYHIRSLVSSRLVPVFAVFCSKSMLCLAFHVTGEITPRCFESARLTPGLRCCHQPEKEGGNPSVTQIQSVGKKKKWGQSVSAVWGAAAQDSILRPPFGWVTPSCFSFFRHIPQQWGQGGMRAHTHAHLRRRYTTAVLEMCSLPMTSPPSIFIPDKKQKEAVIVPACSAAWQEKHRKRLPGLYSVCGEAEGATRQPLWLKN